MHIPFDIEKYKTGKYQVITRGGDSVLELHVFETLLETDYPLRAVLGKHPTVLESFTATGNWLSDSDPGPRDLLLVVPTITRWTNVFSDVASYMETGVYLYFYATEQEAARAVTGYDIKAYQIPVELPIE